jgi:hypothetical protein
LGDVRCAACRPAWRRRPPGAGAAVAGFRAGDGGWRIGAG